MFFWGIHRKAKDREKKKRKKPDPQNMKIREL